jgi:sec-independent protein translocase protein TatA
MLPHLGLPELLLILAIVVLLFGVNKLPRLGRGLGEGIRNFKQSLRGDQPNDDPGANDSKSDEAPRRP